jgi:hypothetical protein
MIKDNIKQLEPVDNIQKLIKEVFDVDLDISGGWGYDYKNPLIIKYVTIPKEQFIHMSASMRANIEMNMTLNEDERYGAINLILKNKKEIIKDNKTYTVASFKITAINEKIYANFIQEYKDNYGKKEFDLSDHFKRRKENTIIRNIDYWFLGIE